MSESVNWRRSGREARDMPPLFSSSSSVFSVSGHALCLFCLPSRSLSSLSPVTFSVKHRWVLLGQVPVGSSLSIFLCLNTEGWEGRRHHGLSKGEDAVGWEREERPWVEQGRRRCGLSKVKSETGTNYSEKNKFFLSSTMKRTS